MTKFIKFFIYSLIILLTIWLFFAIFLSKVGLETTRFNHLINQQVEKYNDSLNLDIKKVKIYLNISSLTNPKIEVKSKNSTLTLGKNKIKLDSIKIEINILSYFKNNFILDKFNISTKDNKIIDLISIAALEKSSFIIYNLFIKDG